MKYATAFFAVSILVLASFGGSAIVGDDDNENLGYGLYSPTSDMPLLTMGEDDMDVTVAPEKQNGNKLFYDIILVLIIGLAFAGYLHVKAHPKKK